MFSIFRKTETTKSRDALDPYRREEIQREVDGLLGPNHNSVKLWAETSKAVALAGFPQPNEFRQSVLDFMFDQADEHNVRMPHVKAAIPMMVAAEILYTDEALHDAPPSPVSGGIEGGRYRDDVLRTRAKVVSAGRTLGVLRGSLGVAFLILTKHLPNLALDPSNSEDEDDATGGPTIPLIELLPNVGKAIEEMLLPLTSPEVLNSGLFRKLCTQLDHNQAHISEQSRSKAVVPPSQYVGRPAETLRAYLGATALEQIFYAPIPFRISPEDRGEHTAIVAGSGWGKTQLLQSIIAGDLETEDPPAMVIIDSTGAMVQCIQRLAIFNERLKDRLLIIDPELDPVPALNPFDLSNPRFASYDAALRERMQGEVIDLFNYVFSTIKNPLTTRMETAFAFMVRLLLSIPGANIHTLLDLLNDEPIKGNYEQAVFKPHIDQLDPTTQLFFKAQYYTGRDGGLREQIRARVFDILRVPAFERMFSTVNKLDFFTELNRGSIVLVNTSENLLKDGSATFGRYIIARVMAAAFERAPIPREERRQAFLIVDEAAPYFDEQFEKLLNRVRQFKLGAVIAFQNLEQANENLRSTIASSTAIKYAGGTGANDARWLSREMRCEPEFIMNQKRDARPPKWTQFACYVRNFTDRAVSLTVPFFTIENMSKMSDAKHTALLERNRARVSHSAPIRSPEKRDAAVEPAEVKAPVPETVGKLLDLAGARAALEKAIKDMDWAKAGELQHSIIPALEREVTAAAERPGSPSAEVPPPRNSTARPDPPRPIATPSDKVARTEPAREWC